MQTNKRSASILWLKRLMLVILSLIIGYVMTWIVVHTRILMPVQGARLTLDTTFADYGIGYATLTILAFAFATGLWLDKFMKTGLLPS